MRRRGKFVVGGLVIVEAIAYLIWAGVSQSVVYFVTPSELRRPRGDQDVPSGWPRTPGSLKWEPQSPISFTLWTKANVSVKHKGAPPDLFAEGRGAVVEGAWTREGYFKASLILAKHSEEYKAPHDGAEPGYKELIKSLRKESTR
jgi:cytochrome c-type biogenesis protein CcmE